MIGQGSFTETPKQRLRMLAMLLVAWQVLICVLGVWWATLLMRQSVRISELESQIGISKEQSDYHVEKTQRMLFWESTTFLILLCGSTAMLSFLYFRDVKRARSFQAFFAAFTHELRTPLTSMRLQAEAIADQTEETDLVRRLLQDTQRLESQVNRTLELARVEGGGVLHTKSIGLGLWLSRWKNAAELTTDVPVKVEIKSGDISGPESFEEVTIVADAHALQIIFKNILENSIRHSTQEKELRLSVVISKVNDKIDLLIKDNGKGFVGAEKNAEKNLGEIFHKGGKSQGAGVGLYLVKMLMQKMGGHARFSSEADGFSVHLQFAAGEATDGE